MYKWFLKIQKYIGRQPGGDFSGLLAGSGVEVEGQRAYMPGDEKRSINAKLSAKYQTLFVNVFQDEKAIDVHICCDINYNRRSGNDETNAKSFLRFFAGICGYFQASRSRISVMLPNAIYSGVEQLAKQRSFVEAYEKRIVSTLPVYNSSLHRLLRAELMSPKRRLIIVVSDFLSYDDEAKKLIAQLSERHEVRLVNVFTAGTEKVGLSGSRELINFLK